MITIVSGLPRSGTSLMMQMLENGGMPVLYDNVREADESNPKGYYELEKVKSIEKDNSWVAEAEGKVLKVVAPLLHALPSNLKYRIIFMERPLDEIIRSQRDMLQRNGSNVDQNDDETLTIAFGRQLRQIKDWLLLQENMDVCFVGYQDVMDHAEAEISRIVEFLGFGLNRNKMLEAIESDLYRHRLKETAA